MRLLYEAKGAFLEIQSGSSIAHLCAYLKCYDSEGGHSFVFIPWVQSLLVTALTDLEYNETKFEGF
jgi:hypothetical protein